MENDTHDELTDGTWLGAALAYGISGFIVGAVFGALLVALL